MSMGISGYLHPLIPISLWTSYLLVETHFLGERQFIEIEHRIVAIILRIVRNLRIVFFLVGAPWSSTPL
jgi:hypothetical protein